MSKVQRFEDLKCWQVARSLVKEFTWLVKKESSLKTTTQKVN
jgi:hypothetical protein